MKDTPDWEKLPKGSPENLLRRCLEKDRKQRLQAIGEARIALANPERAVAKPTPDHKASQIAFGAVALLAVAAALWGWLRPRAVDPKPVTRYTIALPARPNSPNVPSFSPDGTMMAYTAGAPPMIYVRRMDQFDARPVSGTEDTSGNPPCFSTGGEWIAYSADRFTAMKTVRLSGGGSLTLVP